MHAPAGNQVWNPTSRGLEARLENGLLALAFLAPGMVRVRFTPGSDFVPSRPWDPARPDEDFEPPSLAFNPQGESLEVQADPLRVRLDLGRGTLAFSDLEGRRFAEDLGGFRVAEVAAGTEGLASEHVEDLPPGRARRLVLLDKAMHAEEGYYGFGQRSQGLERRGNRFTHWNQDAAWGHNRSDDNLYQSHPVFLALRPGFTWGLWLRSTWWSRFDVGRTRPGVLELATLGGELDYVLFHGPDPAGVVEKLTRLTGRPMLPPLWSLGYHQSRWSYRTAREVEDLVGRFRSRSIPLDAVHLDIDYMRGYRCFTWDPVRFPDPAGTMDRLRSQGVRAVAIVDPGIKHEPAAGYPVVDEMLARGLFCRARHGQPFQGFCWPDAALFPDFAREEVRHWWGQQHRPLLEAGVAGIWQDMNEPSVFARPFSEGEAGQMRVPLDLMHGDADAPAPHAEVHNAYGLLMCQATRQGLERLRPDQRPWTLTRSAGTGVQALSCTWMGDNTSWWEHLQMSLPQLASMGLSGVPHAGVDIGGFIGNCTAELLVRWTQAGVFYPFMRNHSAWDTVPQEPWAFGPETEALVREAIALRYRLLPYLLTLAHRAHRTGEPILRPMLYDFPDQEELRHLDDQFMFGPALLVAPVVRQGHRHRLVHLPPGEWLDFWDGTRYQGPLAMAVAAPLERIPLFVRAGAVLTLGNERLSTDDPLTELTLEVFPGDVASEWTWIEEGGLSPVHGPEDLAETRVSIHPGTFLEVRVHPRSGGWQPHPRTLRMRLHCPERPARVLVDQQGCEWTWNGRCAEVSWPDEGRLRVVRCC